MSVYDCTSDDTRDQGLDEAATALSHGDLVVLPTDTVYGVAAGAFDPEAVAALLAAKGRGRHQPPPVLVASSATLPGLATDLPDVVHRLIEAFWPGPLTIICRAQPTLAWDLGDTGGTVALRMPDEETALALLARTGPLAVSSANRNGRPAATTVLEAATALGDAVSVYLDGGPTSGSVPSTIIDATGEVLRIVREGALSLAQLAEVAPELAPTEDDETAADAPDETAADAPDETAADAPDETAADAAVPESGSAAEPSAHPDLPGQGGADDR
ncbi:L-threonylcarbamoyladenylate synthase [Georgenia sp. MJ173]|uniref:L-threonylcarbamoyladenylate synthase n=1 Tax=Georgenia sunbinii TaxID=3117728 RepID=UPI002F266633